MANDSFLVDGISLGIPNQSATDITTLDSAITCDISGNLVFKDQFTENLVDVDGNPKNTVTLKELYERINGVYVSNGKLFFKDSTVSRPFSLKEIIESYSNWKSKLTTGGIFWLGSTKITNNDCNNLMVNVDGDPTYTENTLATIADGRTFTKLESTNDYPSDAKGTVVFSLDQYLSNLDDYNSITNPNGYAYTSTGEMRWHTVPNLSIILPPLDSNKLCYLMAKINVRLIKNEKPVLFRLYDETVGVELDRKSVNNNSKFPTEQQPVLSFIGKVPVYSSKYNVDCGCSLIKNTSTTENSPPHTISVQFHCEDILTDNVLYDACEGSTNIAYRAKERRLIGFPNSISSTPIVNLSIDAIIYDINKNDSFGRKVGGNVSFSNENTKVIQFEKAYTDNNYTISLSSNKNINMWYINKKSTGFTIVAENKFTGYVDWIATKINSEGIA